MSRTLASVSTAMLVLTLAMGLKTATGNNGDVMMVHGVAPAPMQSSLNGPDPTPAPWKHAARMNGPDPTPAPWKK